MPADYELELSGSVCHEPFGRELRVERLSRVGSTFGLEKSRTARILGIMFSSGYKTFKSQMGVPSRMRYKPAIAYHTQRKLGLPDPGCLANCVKEKPLAAARM